MLIAMTTLLTRPIYLSMKNARLGNSLAGIFVHKITNNKFLNYEGYQFKITLDSLSKHVNLLCLFFWILGGNTQSAPAFFTNLSE